MAVKKTGQPRRTAWLRPIGVIRSTIKTRHDAPKQGSEGAPDAWLDVAAFAVPALDGLAAGDEIIVVTWLHQARRDVLKVHPRGDKRHRLTGVFATRSPDRPIRWGSIASPCGAWARTDCASALSKSSTALPS